MTAVARAATGLGLRNQMRRLFNASVQLIYEDGCREASASSFVADRTDFWWNERKPDEPMLWESKIYLGGGVFPRYHPPPRAARHEHPPGPQTLRPGPRSLPVAQLPHLRLRAPLQLSWRQVYRQFGLHPAKASDKRTVLNFRRKILRELKKIKIAWPELNYSTAPGLLILHPSTPPIAPSDHRQLTS